jgi:hypothetical protein
MKKNISKLMVLSSLLAGFLIIGPVAAEAAIPAQFLAKMYTEALGRAPDQGGWQGWVNWFQSNTCSQATLKTGGEAFYNSPEYNSLGYDPAAKLLTAYRGILNREPDAGGYTGWLYNLEHGVTSWPALLDAFFNSGEFGNLVQSICSGNPYYFGGDPAITIPTSGGGDFSGGTADALQAMIDGPNGKCTNGTRGIVSLANKALVKVDKFIRIPSGCTLTTVGNLTHNKYALMGRLVRTAHFASPEAVVKLQPGAVLQSVWVDGQRSYVGGFSHEDINISMRGASDAKVLDNRSSNSAGWNAIWAADLESHAPVPCQRLRIEGNLVTAYDSDHFNSSGRIMTDGISVNGCEDATVQNNDIVDVTDVGIILFRARPGVVQASLIQNNTIVAAGSSMGFAIAAEPHQNVGDQPSFSGSSVRNNVIWSGPNNHIDITLGVGTRTVWGTSSDTGIGASFSGNNSGSLSVRTTEAISVAGMNNPYIQNNNLQAVSTPTNQCPLPAIANAVAIDSITVYAPQNIQDPKQTFADNLFVDNLGQGCIVSGHVGP